MTPSTPDRCTAVVIAPSERLGRLAAALGADELAGVEVFPVADEVGMILKAYTLAVLDGDVRQLRSPAFVRRLRERSGVRHIVMVASAADGHAVRRALEAGVDGMVGAADVERALAPTVRAVLAGQVVVPVALRGRLVPPALSFRERQVLALVVEGCTNGQIAQRLFLAESTVKSHLATAFVKLGVRSRRDAAALVLGGGALSDAVLSTAAGARGTSLARTVAW